MTRKCFLDAERDCTEMCMAHAERDKCEIIETLRGLGKWTKKAADHIQLIGSKLGIRKIPLP